MSATQERGHFKVHTHGFKAPAKLLRNFVKEGDLFKRVGLPDQLCSFKVVKIHDNGEVDFERKLGLGPKRICRGPIKLEFGIPMAECGQAYVITLGGESSCENEKRYWNAIEEERDTVVGKRFLDSSGKPHTVTGYNPGFVTNVISEPYSCGARFAFVDPETPIQVKELQYSSIKEEFSSLMMWKRDYSAEVTIVLCCYFWGIPREVALYVVDLFWLAEYHQAKQK